jgi:transcriptional regulator with XRE-family HTH domain
MSVTLDEYMDETPPTPSARDIGRRIRDLRKAKGMTQADLGAACGLGDSRMSIGRYEIGRMVPGTHVLIRLADVLGASIDYLVTGRPAGPVALPATGRVNVTPVAREGFLAMLRQRERKGIKTYGTTLQTHNGRDALQDLLEELVDAWRYAQQSRIEWDDLIAENARLRADLAELRGTP